MQKKKDFYALGFIVTGTTFDRPQLKQMLADAENGEISTIIVKDLSRFGRLSGMVGYYVDFWFPQNSVRFIAIYDDVDTENGSNEFAAFKNILNEWYTSLPKIANKLDAHKPTFSPAKNSCRTLYGRIFFISYSFCKSAFWQL